MVNGDRERILELSDYWLWIVDDQYVHSPLGADALDQEDNKRGVEIPALARAIVLNAEGKTVTALQEVDMAVNSGEKAPELYWAKGQLEYELGRYDESLQAYEHVLETRPNDKGALFNCALCLEKLGRFEEAAGRLRAVIKISPEMFAAHLGLGGCLLYLDQIDAALAEFNACLSADPEHDRALIGKAAALHLLGRFDEAFELYRVVLRTYSNDPDLLGNLVAVCAARKDEPRLREYAETLLKLKPGSPAALEGLISAAMLRHNYEVAAYYGSQYVKAAPESYEGWCNLGLALQKTGQIPEAMNAYEHAIKLRPDGREALANHAALLHEHDDLEGARQAYERVIEVDPHHAGTLWNLGLLYQKLGEVERAATTFEELVKLQPDRTDAWLRLGYLRLQAGDAPGAIQALEKIAAKPRARSDARVNLAIAYWRAGRLDSAKALMQKALKEHPNTIEFLRVLAAVAVSEANPDEAAKLEAKLDQLGERIPELSYNVGVLLENARRHEDAVPVFQRAAKARPGFAEALLNLGHAFKALGEPKRANECWQEAIAVMPELAGGYFGAAK